MSLKEQMLTEIRYTKDEMDNLGNTSITVLLDRLATACASIADGEIEKVREELERVKGLLEKEVKAYAVLDASRWVSDTSVINKHRDDQWQQFKQANNL